ncbi:MAG: SpoVR family protein [Desulfobacterales bacterium]|nr:SpoVR family protein [Desulfobacterales bacterium]
MKPVVEVVRKTSLFFQPQIRTKIMNEGWASYWHEKLFLQDDRICGHEVDFARIHAGVTAMPRVGLNPYALGMRLFQYIEEHGRQGPVLHRLPPADRRLGARALRSAGPGSGRDFIFQVRENLNDFLFINTFVDQDFVNRFRLFVAGRRLNQAKGCGRSTSRAARPRTTAPMLLGRPLSSALHRHRPAKTGNGALYLVHRFEGKPLVREFIANTLLGIEYLWGKPVQLETSEAVRAEPAPSARGPARHAHALSEERRAAEMKWQRVRLHHAGPQAHTRSALMPNGQTDGPAPIASRWTATDTVETALQGLNHAVGTAGAAACPIPFGGFSEASGGRAPRS